MMSRSLGILFAALAFAIAAPLHAAPSVAAPADSMTYHIERHNQQVIVTDADGKALTTFSAATPTLQGLFTWSAAGPTANTPRSLTLTLKDLNGRRLWSTPVSVVYPQIVSVNYPSTADGTLLTINTTQDNPFNTEWPPASGVSFVVGADGRPLNFGVGSHQFKYVYEPHGFSVVDQNGKTLMHGDFAANNLDIGSPAGYGLHLNQDGTGAMNVNGTEIAINKITKDGKVYQSFPWNGHNVLIEQSCSWNVTSDGDLTVSAPSTGSKSASK